MIRSWWSAFFFGSALYAAGAPVATTAAVASPASQPETVVLLHGIGLRGWTLWRVENALERDGYRVINLTYPSRRIPIEKIAGEWLPAKLRERGVDDATPVHFVTHSMGGIVVRMWLRECGTPSNPGRVVMLAPPNAGSAVPDRMKNFAPFLWFMGPNGPRLGTDENSVPRSLGPWPAGGGEVGVIAGDRSINPLFSAWLREPNDGAVAVANTRLQGMSDFKVLHHSHTFLAWRTDTLQAVKNFLHQGRFEVTPSS